MKRTICFTKNLEESDFVRGDSSELKEGVDITRKLSSMYSEVGTPRENRHLAHDGYNGFTVIRTYTEMNQPRDPSKPYAKLNVICEIQPEASLIPCDLRVLLTKEGFSEVKQ